MKKTRFLIVVILLITTNLIFAQHEYKIVYADGIADLTAYAGDTIKHNISFSMDSLERETLEDGVVMFSAHGSKFFAQKFRVVESVEENVITLFDIVIVDDPSMLLADNTVKADERTLGDSRDNDIGVPYYWFFLFGVTFIIVFFLIKMKF